jgi:ABC-type Fe3+ transport system permease subunit
MLSTYALIVDALALLALVAGFCLAFRQRWLRRTARRLSRRNPSAPPRRPRPDGEDPVQYAMIIAGVMLMAFAILMAAFTTFYELMTAPG